MKISTLFTYFGQGEQGDDGQDDEGQEVEPIADVSQSPKQEGEFYRVQNIADQEIVTELD